MNNELFYLLQISDSALPIGGFSHSAGLETYVQNGVVGDAKTTFEFIAAMLKNNLFYNDGAFLSMTYDAAEKTDMEAVRLIDQRCTASKIPEELRLASQKMGARLLKIFQPLQSAAFLDQYAQLIHSGNCEGHYAIGYALIAHSLQISKADALTGFYYNAAAGMVTNAVKLIPLSQQHGQEILFKLKQDIEKLVAHQADIHPDWIGLSNPGFDMASMEHERLYSRLYMS